MSTKAPVRRRARSHEEHEEHENHERWLVSYADMITVLMALFIVLFAMSTIDKVKFWELRASLADSFGHELAAVQGGKSPTPGDSAPEGPLDSGPIKPATSPAEQKAIEKAVSLARSQDALRAAEKARANVEREVHTFAEIIKAIQKALADKGVAQGTRESVKFRIDERGLVVSVVTNSVIFAADRAELGAGGRKLLAALSPVLKALPNDLHVEGHTNTVPVAPKYFPSEWELSAARATTVVRHLIAGGIAPERMSATGYADQRPLLEGTSSEANRVNRRVEIVVASTLPPEEKALLPVVAETAPAVNIPAH
jgi:chemotaxis protein MotB